MFMRGQSYRRQTELLNAFWNLYAARRREELKAEAAAKAEAEADPDSGPGAPRAPR